MKQAICYVVLLVAISCIQGLQAQSWRNPYNAKLSQYGGRSYEMAEADQKAGKPVRALMLNDYSKSWGMPFEQFSEVEDVSLTLSKSDKSKWVYAFEQLARLPLLKYLKLEIYAGLQDTVSVPVELKNLKNLETLSVKISRNADLRSLWSALPELKQLTALQLDVPLQQTDSETFKLEHLKSLTIFTETNVPSWVTKLNSLEYLTIFGKYSPKGKTHVNLGFLSHLNLLKSFSVNNSLIKSQELKNIPVSLIDLSLQDCTISGFNELTTALNRCQNLESFRLRNSILAPFAETEIIKLSQLKQLHLSNLHSDSLRKQPLTSVPDFSASTQLNALDLYGVLDNKLPKGIEQMTEMESLSMSGNRLTELPDLAKMTKLKFLTVNNNQLKQLPKSVGKLLKLQTINAAQNLLEELPDEIFNSPDLKTLYLGNNQLSSLPSTLTKLKKLNHLDANTNHIKELPKNIGECSRLQYLQLNNNELKSLPNSIGKLKSLTNLNLSNNPLAQLPETIGDCDSLSYLMIGNCALISLPNALGKLPQLKHLNVHNDAPLSVNRQQAQLGIEAKYTIKNYNQVRSLPASLVNCSQLSILDLSGNTSLEEKTLWPIVQQFRLPMLMLNLSNCQLDSIPMTGWQDTQLANLQLGNNQLTQFPTDWFKTKSIKQIALFNNKLPPALMNYSSFEERLLIGEEMGVDVPKPFPKTKEMAAAYLAQAGKKMNTDPLRFVEYMKQVQQIDSTAGKYMPEMWGRFYFFTRQYRRSVDSLTAAVNRHFQIMKNIPDNQKQRFIMGVAPLLDFRGQAKWRSGDSLGAIKDHELLVEEYKLFAPNIWGRLGVWYKLYRPTAGKSGAAFDKAISMYENVRNQPPMVQLSAAEVYFMNDQADKAYEYLFGLDQSKYKPEEKLLAEYLLLVAQIAQKQAGEEQADSFEKRLKSKELQIKGWSYQLFEESLPILEIAPGQKKLIQQLTTSMKAKSVVVD